MSVKWFVCGAGNIDDYGLPSVVHVCPIEGADWSKPYFPESTHPKLRSSAERIEELEAALSEATKGLDYYEECMALRKENEKLLSQDLKATEAETPAPPSKPDQAPPQSSSDHGSGTDVPSQAAFDALVHDFQEHRRDTERSLKTLRAEMGLVAQQSDSVRDRLSALEYSRSEASASTQSIQASHESEDKTPEPQLGDKAVPPVGPVEPMVWRPRGTTLPPAWQKDRRQGKERRQSDWTRLGDKATARHPASGQTLTDRRQSARRKSDRQG